MNSPDFERVIEEQFTLCRNIMIKKADEYATDDRLHNFKVAAELQGVNPKTALAGMMAKHTVSVYDMCGKNEEYSMDMWNEKITDHINYLLLLKALITEAKEIVPGLDLTSKVVTTDRKGFPTKIEYVDPEGTVIYEETYKNHKPTGYNSYLKSLRNS